MIPPVVHPGTHRLTGSAGGAPLPGTGFKPAALGESWVCLHHCAMLSQEQLARAQGRASVSAELHALCLQGRRLDEALLDHHEQRCRQDHGERLEILHSLGRQPDPHLHHYLQGQLERLKLVRSALQRGRDPGLSAGVREGDAHAS
ncbi:MAG: hypothetical protein F4Z75_01545 [Synechococcus sp. SB0668_bin_15]|nr:hypothetical protein [Synechococcus sp. SB0668_bin_15]